MSRSAACILIVLITVAARIASADPVGLANGYGGASWHMSKAQVDSALAETQYIFESSRTGEISFYDSLGGLEADIIPRFDNDSLRDIRLIFSTFNLKRLEADSVFARIMSEIAIVLGEPENSIGSETGMGTTGPAIREVSWSTSQSQVILGVRVDNSGSLQMQLSLSSQSLSHQMTRSRFGRSPSSLSSSSAEYVPPAKIPPDSVEQFPGPDDFVAVSQMPILIHDAIPAYPDMALMDGTEGQVLIKALVDTKGLVRDVRIVKAAEFDVGFETAAIDAAFEKVYKPAIQNGVPVAVWVTYQVDFERE